MNHSSTTTNVRPEQPRAIQWRRIIVFSVLIFATVTLVGILGGISMAHWQIYGATMEEAVSNSRVVRRIAYGVVSALLYWRLTAPLAGHRWLHVLFAFVAVQILDIVVSVGLFHVTASELADPGPIGRAAFAALVGWALACLVPDNPSKPTPLRDAG